MDKAFWFEGYFSEAVSFSKCATFPPASRLEAAGIFHLTASHCVDKSIIALTLKRKTIIGIVPQSCVMNASVSFVLSSFSKWGQLCFCQHSWFNGTPSDEKLAFNQECRWNNGSKSLHSFWATLYTVNVNTACENDFLFNCYTLWLGEGHSRRKSHGAGGGGGGGCSPPGIFQIAIFGQKSRWYSGKTTWLSGKQWRKHLGKRLQPPPPPRWTRPVRIWFIHLHALSS